MGCGETRGFRGFLDVHHILGARKATESGTASPSVQTAIAKRISLQTAMPSIASSSNLRSIQISVLFCVSVRPATSYT